MLLERQYPDVFDRLRWKFVEVNGFVVQIDLHLVDEVPHLLEYFGHKLRGGGLDYFQNDAPKIMLVLLTNGFFQSLHVYHKI